MRPKIKPTNNSAEGEADNAPTADADTIYIFANQFPDVAHLMGIIFMTAGSLANQLRVQYNTFDQHTQELVRH